MVTNWTARLEKTPNNGSFLHFFKILHFSKFVEILEIHQYFLVKLPNALNFYLNTVGKTQ